MRISNRAAALEPSIIREMSGRRRPTSIDLSLGEPALPPEPELLERAFARLKSGPQGYTMNAGMPELREAIARHHALAGRGGAEHVIVTVGSEEAVFLALTTLLEVGDEVLIPEPGYPAYRGIARLLGATPVSYAIRRETGLVPRAEAIARVLTPRARVLVLNGPSNPFGTIDDAEELARLADLARQHDVAVVSDEIYRDLYYRAAPPPSITTLHDEAILIGGLSKSCAMTGLRLGYLVAPADLVKKATLAHQLMVTCAPRIAQLMALDVFEHPEHLRAHVPFYARAREAIEAARPTLPAEAPLHLGDGAFYAVLDVSRFAGGDPLRLALELLDEEDVVAVPGIAFGPAGDWFFRLSYAAGADAIREGLARIARFLGRRIERAR